MFFTIDAGDWCSVYLFSGGLGTPCIRRSGDLAFGTVFGGFWGVVVLMMKITGCCGGGRPDDFGFYYRMVVIL